MDCEDDRHRWVTDGCGDISCAICHYCPDYMTALEDRDDLRDEVTYLTGLLSRAYEMLEQLDAAPSLRAAIAQRLPQTLEASDG